MPWRYDIRFIIYDIFSDQLETFCSKIIIISFVQFIIFTCVRRYRFHNHLCRQNIENRFTRNKISISSQSHREIWNENKTIHYVVDPSRDTDSEAPGNRSSTWSVRLPKLVALSEAVLAQLSTTTMKQNEREQLKWNSFVIAKY